jgi:hypothetical protein
MHGIVGETWRNKWICRAIDGLVVLEQARDILVDCKLSTKKQSKNSIKLFLLVYVSDIDAKLVYKLQLILPFFLNKQ